MAPGGGSRRQWDDEQDGNGEQRPSYQRANSVDEVSGQAPAIVTTFLGECFCADGLPVPQELCENQKRVNKEVAHVIRDIGDRLANDTTLNNLISQVVVSKDTAFDTFLQVGAQIFNNGRVNWGWIVTLFYFGYVALHSTKYHSSYWVGVWIYQGPLGQVDFWTRRLGESCFVFGFFNPVWMSAIWKMFVWFSLSIYQFCEIINK